LRRFGSIAASQFDAIKLFLNDGVALLFETTAAHKSRSFPCLEQGSACVTAFERTLKAK